MLQSGTIIQGIYEVAYPIASGGSGTVYACKSVGITDGRISSYNKSDTYMRDDRIRWAIKEAHAEQTGLQQKADMTNYATNQSDNNQRDIRNTNAYTAAESLQMEVELLKELNHKSLVKVVDVIRKDTDLLMVMEYVRGSTLDAVIRENGALSEDKVIQIGLQIADVLGYLHSRGQKVIYRDLKPSNILLRDDGRVVLVDFGAVFTSSDDFPIMKMSFGTRGYAAPEQYLETSTPDASMDVYAFGRTLTALLTGGSTRFSKLKHISPELKKILKRCTRKKKENRYACIAEVYHDLLSLREKSFIKQIIQVVKLFLFTALAIPSVIFSAEVVSGNKERIYLTIFWCLLTLASFLILRISDSILSLSGIRSRQRIKRQRKSARINGTFQIDEESGIGRALSWDDIEISLDDTSIDLRIELDNNRVQFVNTEDFVMEQDQVLTRRESYRAVY